MTIKQLASTMLAATAMLSATAAVAGPGRNAPVYGKPASISYANAGGIADWHAEDDSSLYIRDRTGRWYYATLGGRCPSLRLSHTIGFETDPMGRFDTWGAVRTRDALCHVRTLVTSPPPAAKDSRQARR